MSDKDNKFDKVLHGVKVQAVGDLLMKFHANLSVCDLPDIIAQAVERGYAAAKPDNEDPQGLRFYESS